MAQLDAPSDWRPRGRGFNPRRGQQYSFVEIDHEIFSTVILSLPLIQEGQLTQTIHKKYISRGPRGFREEDFLKVFPIISLWELYRGMAVILIYEP